MTNPVKEPTDKISEEEEQALRSIIEHFEKEDLAVRERQIRLYKKLEYYWAGFQRIYWDDTAHDWRTWNDQIGDATNLNEAAYYDKPINVFRAFLESIIAALSSSVPGITCFPDDADNDLDVLTARGADKIADLIFKHNDAPLLWCKALFIYCTQGMIAAYNYTEENKKYGSVKVNKYEDDVQDITNQVCPLCKNVIISPDEQEQDETLNLSDADQFGKDDDDAQRDSLESKGVLCLNCQKIVNPDLIDSTIIVSRLTGTTSKPKARQKILVNGGLFVRVPNYARCQDETPYISYCYEAHWTSVLAKYPHLREKLDPGAPAKISSASGSGMDQYERWGRLNTQYLGQYSENTPTCRNWWLRSSTFEYIDDAKIRGKLYKRYPDGAKVTLVNDSFAEACNEDLDDCWTLTYNPLSEYLTFDPLGMLLTSIQDITNDIVALELQNIEHSVPINFADTRVLSAKQLANTEVRPGSFYPITLKAGQDLSKSFFTTTTATLNPAVEEFASKINNMGEFVSGAMPSIFGGAMPSSMRTASQQSMSRNQALQRLQTPWKMLTYWWKGVFSKAIPAYIKTMLEDERIVKKENNIFINTVIKRSELDGKIGEIELEAADNLPQTFEQIRDILTQLMETQNPEIMAALAAPENLEILRQGLGLVDFKVPGYVSRQKQYYEIRELVKGSPTDTDQIDPQSQEPVLKSTITPELKVDDHITEAEICRDWLRSDVGQLVKTENPDGYNNVKAHCEEHLAMIPMNVTGGAQPPMPPANNNAPQKGGPLRPLNGPSGN